MSTVLVGALDGYWAEAETIADSISDIRYTANNVRFLCSREWQPLVVSTAKEVAENMRNRYLDCMTTVAAPSRLDRIKHRQAAAQAGVRGAALRSHGAEVASDDAKRQLRRRKVNEPTSPPAANVVDVASNESLDVDLMSHFDAAAEHALVREFDEVLAAIGQVHGYAVDDGAFIRDFYLPNGVDLYEDLKARSDVKERIRSWMVDLVAFGWEASTGQEHIERRARSTFRMEVMGMSADENGTPYPGIATRNFIERSMRSSATRTNEGM